MTRPGLNIVGCGRAAGSLARLWRDAGAVEVRGVVNRSLDSATRAVERLGGGRALPDPGKLKPAEFWMLGVGDDRIEEVSAQLAQLDSVRQGGLVFHLAGRHGLQVLAPLENAGAEIAALHPVRSLTHEQLGLEHFAGTACVVEGSGPALARLEPLVRAIGGLWLPVSGIDRGLYHAAVSVVSNVTKAVVWKAQSWLQRAGLPPSTAEAVSHQLLESTVEDLFRAGARQSITGPVVRGDTRTVEAHLEAVRRAYPSDVDVYRVLARTIFELAQDRGDLDVETLRRFRDLLGAGS